MNSNHFKIRLWPFLLASLLVSLATFLIPTPSGADRLIFHISTALPVFNVGVLISGVVLFATSLKSFKLRLRRAYVVLFVGFILFTLGALQFPIITIFNLFDTPYATQGFTDIIYIVGTFLAFLGLWLYARLVEIKNIWTSLPAIFGVVAVVIIGAVVLPHVPVDIPEKGFKFLLAFNAWEGFFLGASAVMALLIKRRTNTIYTRAMAWMVIAFSFCSLGVVLIMLAFRTMGLHTWYLGLNIYLLPFTAAAVAWFKSAEAFRNMAAGAAIPLVNVQGEHDFFGNPKGVVSGRSVICADVITFLVSLCSDTSKIDQQLDDMRFITARKGPDEPLTTEEQEKLARVYLSVERYLVEKDPVRNFSRQQLRDLVNERYRGIVDAPAFWQKVDPKD